MISQATDSCGLVDFRLMVHGSRWRGMVWVGGKKIRGCHVGHNAANWGVLNTIFTVLKLEGHVY